MNKWLKAAGALFRQLPVLFVRPERGKFLAGKTRAHADHGVVARDALQPITQSSRLQNSGHGARRGSMAMNNLRAPEIRRSNSASRASSKWCRNRLAMTTSAAPEFAASRKRRLRRLPRASPARRRRPAFRRKRFFGCQAMYITLRRTGSAFGRLEACPTLIFCATRRRKFPSPAPSSVICPGARPFKAFFNASAMMA